MRARTAALIGGPGVVLALLVLFVVPSIGFCAASTMPGIHPDRIELPEGFRFSVYARDVPGARSMTLGDGGTLFVGSRAPGKVYAVRDEDGDGAADRVTVIATGLSSPNGVAFRKGALYVAEISRILRFDDIEARLDDPPEPVVVRDDFPTEEHHGWKFIAFGPDGKLYVPVGAPGNNVLREDEPIFASITRMNPDGSDREIFARGVRNTVGFDWHPDSGVLWFTDNGRDWLGNDRPPDELNRAPEPGLHFGYPFRHGKDVVDPEFGEEAGGREYMPPAIELGPHVAALGMRFYRGDMFPGEYRGDVLIAEHGSWNRDEPIGYRVMRVKIDGKKATAYEPFATGWLVGDRAWGRPVDVQELPDGSVLVSDDRSGAIYRITYGDE